MSLIVRPTVPVESISMLTLVMGLSVAEGVDLAVKETSSGSSFACKIKWPNDVVLEGRKICGILTELHMAPEGGIGDVVIGVGINVNMVRFPEEIRDIAGSIGTQTGVRVDRSLVVARVMERFEENYGKFEKSCNLAELKEQYEARLVNKGQEVLILDAAKPAVVAGQEAVESKFKENSEELGTCLGISENGDLIVEFGDGEVRKINAGDVSVRGLYGYV